MRFHAILLLTIGFHLPQLAGAQNPDQSGSVCIAPISAPNSNPISLANPAGGNRSFNFEIQIDSLPKISISTKVSQKVRNLSISKPHRVRIFRDGKPFESFRFQFSNYKRTNLCLWFKELYETWSLTDSNPGGVQCDLGSA